MQTQTHVQPENTNGTTLNRKEFAALEDLSYYGTFLTLCMLGKIFSRQHFKFFSYFS